MSLQDDLWPTLFHDDVGCSTIVDSVSSRSSHISACFFELEKLNQELKSKLRDDFLGILNSMSNISLSSTQQLPSPSPSPPSRSSSLINDTSFTTEAYSWLLENIANPYPSSTVKTSLAQRYNYSLPAINSWFVNARRRMGWTALCRDYFNSCRADALDAAHRVLVKEDPNCQLSPYIIHAFISVKVATEELCSLTMTQRTLVSDLETVVRDVSEKGSASVCKQQCYIPEGTLSKTSVAKLQKKKTAVQGCFPSSNHTSSALSVPALCESLADESEGDSVILPPIHAGHKRRLSSSEATHTPLSESTTRPVKRLRSNKVLATASLPSPTTSTEKASEDDQVPQSIPISQGSTDSTTRKRRLSDADAIGPQKRPRDSMPGSPLHATSDPLPLFRAASEGSTDEWFKTNFDALFALPSPVDATEPDPSSQWEVELFNHYCLLDNPQKALTPSVLDNPISTSIEWAPFDNLLKYLENDRSVSSPGMIQLSTMSSLPTSTSRGLPLPLDLPQAIDWTVSLNQEPTSNPVFPRSCNNQALPEIDLSVLQLPHNWTTVVS